MFWEMQMLPSVTDLQPCFQKNNLFKMTEDNTQFWELTAFMLWRKCYHTHPRAFTITMPPETQAVLVKTHHALLVRV